MALHLREERLLGDGDRVVVAFSGGPDSTALLHALAALAAGPGPRLRLVAAHLDHGLRPGSAEDARAARAAARALGVPFRAGKARGLRPAGGGSPEAAARRARYDFLARVARATGARAVALAHHRGDRVETVLHRLLQGGNLRGLAGIPHRRPLPGAPGCVVVRPLLRAGRDAILAYLRDRGIPWSEDPTNRGEGNARARLRSTVLPALLAAYPAAEESLLRLEGLAREASDLLDRDLRAVLRGVRARGGAAALPRAAFKGRSEEGVRRLLGGLLSLLPGARREPALAAVRRVLDALGIGDGRPRRVPLGGGAEAEVGPERVRVRAGVRPGAGGRSGAILSSGRTSRPRSRRPRGPRRSRRPSSRP